MADSTHSPDQFEVSTPIRQLLVGDEARSAIRSHASPEGVVTILFTDIVDSTRLRQRVGDIAAQERLREHNSMVRDQLAKHGGFEVKTQGDGFMVAFSDVVAALACAVDIQKEIAEDNRRQARHPLRVRMGLNCGQVIKEQEDFFGGVVIVASRLCAMAKGNQILVSEAVRVLAGLPRGIGYIRYGRRRLKGLADSYSIWSVPWSEAPRRGLASPALRVGLPSMMVLVAVAGIIVGFGLRTSDGSGSPARGAAPPEITISYTAQSIARIESGDCQTADLVIRGALNGTVTGDAGGHLTGIGEVRGYASDNCQTGYSKMEFTLTDANGSSVAGTLEGPLNRLTMLNPVGQDESRAGYGVSVLTVTRGSGVYEGATGSGTCSGLVSGQFRPDGSVPSETEGTCSLQLSTTTHPVVVSDPVVVQLAATPLQVSVSPREAIDPVNTVGLAVVYGNTQDVVQHDLRLRLREPSGASIVASALGEAPALVTGGRSWSLPELGPGELRRFEFSMRFVSSDAASAEIAVELEGTGFEHPVVSNAITIELTP